LVQALRPTVRKCSAMLLLSLILLPFLLDLRRESGIFTLPCCFHCVRGSLPVIVPKLSLLES
jgi:hypothetical protein